MLGLHTGPGSRPMRGATPRPNEDQEQEKPLTLQVITTVLRYLLPPSSTEIPSMLLSEQLRRRHHFLSIPPSDHASYLCLNPDHSSQDTELVLSTLQKLAGQTPEQLIGRIAYFSDGEELTGHVIIGKNEEQGSIQIIFSWETDNETSEWAWRYLDVKPLPLPKGAVDTLQQAQDARAKARSSGPLATNGVHPATDDSYWSRYDNVTASVSNGRASADGRPHLGIPRNGSGFSQRSLSPRREEAYWDRYGYGDDDDEEEEGPSIAAPVGAPRPNLTIYGPPANQFIPTQVWTADSARFNPEDLSEALAMHLQPDLAPSSDIAQGLSLNLNTPPPSAPPFTQTIDLASPVSDRFPGSDIGVRTNGNTKLIGRNGIGASESGDDKAVSEAVRGVFQLWRNLRESHGKGSMTPIEEKDTFISLVAQSLASL